MKNLLLLTFLLTLIFSNTANSQNDAIHVEIYGQGKPLVFIPGFTVPGSVWMPTVKALEKNYECHVITLAGFGGKAPIEFPWLPKVNQELKNYILQNKLHNASIVGHSLGGTIAIWLAAELNTSLSKIILVDALPAAGALMIPNYNADQMVYDHPYNKQQLEMDHQTFEQQATMMSKSMSLKTTEQERIKNWILSSDRKTYVYGYTDYLKLDVRENLKKIAIPVYIIAATKPYGKEIVGQNYQNQYENLKKYELIMAENCAHFVMLDDHEWFMEQIKIILKSEQ